jgi:hypothetical protein
MPANVRNYGDQGGAGQHIGGTFTVESGGTIDLASGAVMKTDGVAFDRLMKIARVALGHADTAGGVVAWANPEGAAILVSRMVIDVNTKATGACTVDAGVAANVTTSNDGLLDGLDVGTAAGAFDNITDKGTNGKSRQKVTPSQFVTISVASGASAGLVGFAYIYYHRV